MSSNNKLICISEISFNVVGGESSIQPYNPSVEYKSTKSLN